MARDHSIPAGEEEELEELSLTERTQDKLYKQPVVREVNGEVFEGYIEDIEQGKVSKEKLYRVRYSDGDLEHLVFDDAKACVKAASDREQPQGYEDHDLRPSKRPAATSAPTAKAAKASPKVKAKTKAAPAKAVPKPRANAKGKAKAAPKAKAKTKPKVKAKAKGRR